MASHGLGHCTLIHSHAAKVSARRRQCPACDRKAALRDEDGGFACRWCGEWWTERQLRKIQKMLTWKDE